MVNFTKDFALFNHENLGSVRTLVDETGTIWFVAKDVCNVLEIQNPSSALGRLDEDERCIINPHNFTLDSIEGEKRTGSELNIINESGMYSLVLGSRKPQAKEFKQWLTKEVIPSIRQHGGYIYGQEKLSEKEQKMIKESITKMHQQVKKLRERRHELLGENAKLKEYKRYSKKEMKAMNECTNIFIDLFDKAQQDYVKEHAKVRVLENKIKYLENPELLEQEKKAREKEKLKQEELKRKSSFLVGKDGLIISQNLLSKNEDKEENIDYD